jgi:hypothetical protein
MIGQHDTEDQHLTQGERRKVAQALRVMTRQVGPGLAKPE